MWTRSTRFPPGSHSCWPRAGTQPTSSRHSLTPGRPSSGSSNRWAGARNLTLPLVASAGPACVVIKASPVCAARHSTALATARALPVNKYTCEGDFSHRAGVRVAVPPCCFCCCCCCQALIAAHEVMEVRRTLYFAENLGNRNIGGGMRVGAVCPAWKMQLLSQQALTKIIDWHTWLQSCSANIRCSAGSGTLCVSLDCRPHFSASPDVGPRHAGQRGPNFHLC